MTQFNDANAPMDWESLPAIMDVRQTAKFLGVGYRTILQLAHSKTFPALKLGKKFLVSRDGLRTWLEQQTQK